jgi:hypothetical protein
MKTHSLFKGLFKAGGAAWLMILFIGTPLFRLPGFAQKPARFDPALPQVKSAASDDDRIDSIVYEDYITDEGLWKTYLKYQRDYDAEGHYILCTAYYRSDDYLSWVNWWKEDYTHDEDGNMVQSQYYMWTDSGTWRPERKGVYSYDAGGNMISYFIFNWNIEHGKWVNAWKGELTVNANGLNTDDMIFKWNTSGEVWINDYKDEFSYDDDGNRTESIGYSWITESSAWNPESRFIHAWDENGNEILITGYDWNETQMAWQLDNKREYTFDANGNRTLNAYYVWDSSTEVWTAYDKTGYTYDGQGRIFQELNEDWDLAAETWVNDLRRTYYYHAQSTGLTDDVRHPDLPIHPNPSSDYILLDLVIPSSEGLLLILYNMQGQVVLAKTLHADEHVQVGHLPDGIYNCRVVSGDGVMTGKLMIRKQP